MKRLIVLLVLLFSVNNLFGQTYFYKYLYHVEKDSGAKTKLWSTGGDTYITFTNNFQYCYQSDKDGIQQQYCGSYRYIGVDNGRITYFYTQRDSGNPFMQNYPLCYYYFSSDYSRLNTWSDCSDLNLKSLGGKSYIVVYERAEAPSPQNNAPDQLW